MGGDKFLLNNNQKKSKNINGGKKMLEEIYLNRREILDEVIKTIRKSKNKSDAIENLVKV